MEPSIKKINVGETVKFSHINVYENRAIIHFESGEQLVVLDEMTVRLLKMKARRKAFSSEFDELNTPTAHSFRWVVVTIECNYHTPIKTVCLQIYGSPESMKGEPLWVRGFDPYSEFVKVVYKSIHNKALSVWQN